MRTPVVAIVGRTNVGKSSIFNALAGKALSIVRDEHGVTRDRHYALVTRFEIPFVLIDTGGLLGEDDDKFQHLVRAQSEIAMHEADVIVAVFDGLSGPTAQDGEVVHLLRRFQKPVVWVVNKCEKTETALASAEFYGLGIDPILPVSSAHSKGLRDVVALIREALKGLQLGEKEPLLDEKALRIAIIGRPNVGKSTFVNALAEENRVVVSPFAGTTTDNVDVTVEKHNERYTIVDTAGLRKKARVEDFSLEDRANMHAISALNTADVGILLIDGTEGVTEQDSKIAGLVHERGKPFVIAVNKWDIVPEEERDATDWEKYVREELKFLAYAPVIFLSAATGRRCEGVLKLAREVWERSKLKLKTSEVNDIFHNAFNRRPPPVYRGQPIKLMYGTQVSETPPTFLLFVSHPDKLDFAYERYLKNTMRESHNFEGTDIRLIFRKRNEKDGDEAR